MEGPEKNLATSVKGGMKEGIQYYYSFLLLYFPFIKLFFAGKYLCNREEYVLKRPIWPFFL